MTRSRIKSLDEVCLLALIIAEHYPDEGCPAMWLPMISRSKICGHDSVVVSQRAEVKGSCIFRVGEVLDANRFGHVGYCSAASMMSPSEHFHGRFALR